MKMKRIMSLSKQQKKESKNRNKPKKHKNRIIIINNKKQNLKSDLLFEIIKIFKLI